MYELENADYECPRCERKHPWRPEAAGRPAGCACGATFIIPFNPGPAVSRHPPDPAAPTRHDHGGEMQIEIEPAPEKAGDQTGGDVGSEGEEGEEIEIVLCPDCGATMRAGAIVCPHCGYHRALPRKRVFRRREPGEQYWPGTHAPFTLMVRPFRDVALPIVLAIAGIVVEVAMLAHTFTPPHNVADAIAFAPLIVLLAAATVGIVFLIALVLTPVLDLSLGPVGPLAIKLSAAVIFPAAVAAMLYAMCGRGPSGWVVGWMAGVILYLSLFRLLFEFDWPDAMLLIAFVSLAHAITLGAVLWPLTHGPLPLWELWQVFGPIIAQSALTFGFAGGMVAPHFGEA